MLKKLLKSVVKQKHQTHLVVGSTAPSIHGNDQDGNAISLDKFLGKKVVLYFYPKDDTPGCTTESCNLRDNYNLLKSKGFEVIGVSADNELSHKKFIKKYQLPFTLLADTDMKIINDYGVWGEKTVFGKTFEGIVRTTFVISEKGIIEKIINEVNNADHTNQVLSN